MSVFVSVCDCWIFWLLPLLDSRLECTFFILKLLVGIAHSLHFGYLLLLFLYEISDSLVDWHISASFFAFFFQNLFWLKRYFWLCLDGCLIFLIALVLLRLLFWGSGHRQGWMASTFVFLHFIWLWRWLHRSYRLIYFLLLSVKIVLLAHVHLERHAFGRLEKRVRSMAEGEFQIIFRFFLSDVVESCEGLEELFSWYALEKVICCWTHLFNIK